MLTVANPRQSRGRRALSFPERRRADRDPLQSESHITSSYIPASPAHCPNHHRDQTTSTFLTTTCWVPLSAPSHRPHLHLTSIDLRLTSTSPPPPPHLRLTSTSPPPHLRLTSTSTSPPPHLHLTSASPRTDLNLVPLQLFYGTGRRFEPLPSHRSTTWCYTFVRC